MSKNMRKGHSRVCPGSATAAPTCATPLTSCTTSPKIHLCRETSPFRGWPASTQVTTGRWRTADFRDFPDFYFQVYHWEGVHHAPCQHKPQKRTFQISSFSEHQKFRESIYYEESYGSPKLVKTEKIWFFGAQDVSGTYSGKCRSTLLDTP